PLGRRHDHPARRGRRGFGHDAPAGVAPARAACPAPEGGPRRRKTPDRAFPGRRRPDGAPPGPRNGRKGPRGGPGKETPVMTEALPRRTFLASGLAAAAAACRPSPADRGGDPARLTLAEAAAAVRSGTVTPVELTEAWLA